MTFIVKPLVTEKMTKLTDKSSVAKTYKVKGQERTKKAETKYGFIVLPEANKLQIKKEIETRYNVTVLDVNTMVYAGKRQSRYTRKGLVKGQKNSFKKAIVTLKEGDVIDFYSNIENKKWQYVNLNRLLRDKDTRLLARSRRLLHPCQRSLSFSVSVLLVVETTPVR